MPPTNRRPSATLVIALIALVAALAGTAAALPGKHSVDRNDIAKNAVKTRTIKSMAVTEAKLANGAVSSFKIADGAVLAAKIADAAVQSDNIADAAVTKTKVANDAIDSSKVQDESINAPDLGPGVISVVAYGKVINASGSAPAIAPGAIGLDAVTAGTDGQGRTTVTVSPDVVGASGLSQCTAQATAAAPPEPNDTNTLEFDSATVAMGPPAASRAVQVQTRGVNEVVNDYSYYLQITCPNV